MKKAIIFSLIFLLAFLFLTISCFANDTPDFADFWSTLNNYPLAKKTYLGGLKDGLNWSAYLTSIFNEMSKMSGNSIEELEAIIAELEIKYEFIALHSDKLINVMDHLYKDPANSYISTHKMVFIAQKKLMGEDIESVLQSARKNAFDNPPVSAKEQQEKELYEKEMTDTLNSLLNELQNND